MRKLATIDSYELEEVEEEGGVSRHALHRLKVGLGLASCGLVRRKSLHQVVRQRLCAHSTVLEIHDITRQCHAAECAACVRLQELALSIPQCSVAWRP